MESNVSESIDSVELRNMVYEEGMAELLEELHSVHEEERVFGQELLLLLASDAIHPWQVLMLNKMKEDENSVMVLAKTIHMLENMNKVPRPYEQHFVTERGSNRITPENFSDKMNLLATRYFRFNVVQMNVLVVELKVPNILIFNGYKTNSHEALSILFHRQSSGVRYIDLVGIYDILPGMMSQIFYGMSVFIFRKFGHLVRMFEQSFTTERALLDSYAQAISLGGCPLEDLVGFADGTCIEVAKPTRGQRSVYCGHHQHHCLKFLVVVYPNGMMTAFGPFDGSVHDSTMAGQIRLDHLVEENYTFEDRQFVLYVDAGFALGQAVITPFRRNRNMTFEQRAWNRAMSSSRISVEWGIGRVKNSWRILSSKSNMRTLLQPVSILVINSFLFTNISAIMNGSIVESRFGVETPSLREYLSGV